jgi:5,10-methylene-tetrahydrofolate dehydrogenase/methenyl tetrahydrofolate cyclohydrolase
VRKFNEDKSIHGILVQLPLPIHVNETRVLDEVHREKDVDGFHPLNIGQLAMKGYEPAFVSCTPKGCLELLLRENIPIAGKHAVIIGRSNIVGIPMSLLLLKQNATVTVCHSRTENLPELVKQADIVVAAIGRPLFVQKEWIKPGATIIDVGINSLPDATRKTGYALFGQIFVFASLT